jgi:hypothetical protein
VADKGVTSAIRRCAVKSNGVLCWLDVEELGYSSRADMAEGHFFGRLPIGGWLAASSAVLWLQLGTNNYRFAELCIVTCPPERIGKYRIGADNFSQSLLSFSFRCGSVRKFVRVMSFHEGAVGAFDPFHASFLRYAQDVVMRSHDQAARVVQYFCRQQGTVWVSGGGSFSQTGCNANANVFP